MKTNKLLAIGARILLILTLSSCAQLPATITPTTSTIPTATGLNITATSISAPLPPEYDSPLPNAEYISTGTTIAVRYGPNLTQQQTSGLNFEVVGSVSGLHSGKTILADDHQTVIFKPDQPFTAGEKVQVHLNGLQYDAETAFTPLDYTFNVAVDQRAGGVGASNQPPSSPPKSAFPNDLTVPQDIPHFTVSVPSTDNSEGDIFVAPFYWTRGITGSYLLILDGQGHLIYYQSMAQAENPFDFKVQPNGMLSYYDAAKATFYVMNSHYQVVNSYQAGNGYTADLHDLQILPNGDALLMAYDTETVDMSQVTLGGKTNAAVTGLVIQELDPSKNVIFQWRSWDHIPFTDSTSLLTDQTIDLVHGNALALSNDGNLLVSCRNLSEILKINLQTGAVMWRLGGKANQFAFLNDGGFAYQHDVRQLPNGDITVFDNHGTEQNPAPSRGVEYRLDMTNMTATKVWEYTPTPPVFTSYMGNVQRLSDGDTFMDWGSPFITPGYQYQNMIEVNPDNQVIFEFAFDSPYVSYRAFRTPWQGFPTSLPDLAYKTSANGLTLGYSWNGATQVAAWRLYGGDTPDALSLVDQKAKTDFETQTLLANPPSGECYFQAAAIDQNGNEMARSQVISTNPAACPPVQ